MSSSLVIQTGIRGSRPCFSRCECSGLRVPLRGALSSQWRSNSNNACILCTLLNMSTCAQDRSAQLTQQPDDNLRSTGVPLARMYVHVPTCKYQKHIFLTIRDGKELTPPMRFPGQDYLHVLSNRSLPLPVEHITSGSRGIVSATPLSSASINPLPAPKQRSVTTHQVQAARCGRGRTAGSPGMLRRGHGGRGFCCPIPGCRHGRLRT